MGVSRACGWNGGCGRTEHKVRRIFLGCVNRSWCGTLYEQTGPSEATGTRKREGAEMDEMEMRDRTMRDSETREREMRVMQAGDSEFRFYEGRGAGVGSSGRFLARKKAELLLWLAGAAVCAVIATGTVWAQGHPQTPGRVQDAAHPAAQVAVTSDKDVQATQEELIHLLRLSPTLTSVVARDPSLLANKEYVRANNPQLAQFLENHPEVELNPGYYLFTHLHTDGQPDEALEREVWPDLPEMRPGRLLAEELSSDITPMIVMICVIGALLWLTKFFVENRRWTRIFKQNSDVHARIIERFGSNQELLTYMSTDAGKRFLEAAPIAMDLTPEQRMPNAVARVLTPIQIGIVMALLGTGFLLLHTVRPDPDYQTSMLVLGTIFLMPGIGFILSAGVTWVLARRLGLMPDGGNGTAGHGAPYDARERQ